MTAVRRRPGRGEFLQAIDDLLALGFAPLAALLAARLIITCLLSQPQRIGNVLTVNSSEIRLFPFPVHHGQDDYPVTQEASVADTVGGSLPRDFAGQAKRIFRSPSGTRYRRMTIWRRDDCLLKRSKIFVPKLRSHPGPGESRQLDEDRPVVRNELFQHTPPLFFHKAYTTESWCRQRVPRMQVPRCSSGSSSMKQLYQPSRVALTWGAKNCGAMASDSAILDLDFLVQAADHSRQLLDQVTANGDAAGKERVLVALVDSLADEEKDGDRPEDLLGEHRRHCGRRGAGTVRPMQALRYSRALAMVKIPSVTRSTWLSRPMGGTSTRCVLTST